MTQALGTPEHRQRVRGVGGLVTPSLYFHKHIPTEPTQTSKNDDPETSWKKEKVLILDQYNLMVKRMHELNSQMKVEETRSVAHDQQIIPSPTHEEKINQVKVIFTWLISYCVDGLFDIDNRLTVWMYVLGETL